MRKQLGVLASLLLLCATALLWAGCQDRCYDKAPVRCEQPCKPVCPQPCKPVCPEPCRPVCPEPCKPECAPAPCCEEPLCKIPAKCKHPARAELCCVDGITVTGSNPPRCLLGEQYPLDFDIHACKDVCDVKVTTHLPEGVTFVRSVPEAKVEGRKLTWDIGPMDKDQCIHVKVWVKCECEGEQCACFCATATPVRFCSLICAKPLLTCEKCGPEEVCPGDPVHYTITVTNRGSCTAEDVVVTDSLPDGLVHESGLRTLTFKLGCLEPCQTKTVNFCVVAEKRGKVTNNVVVSACNADTVSCAWTTCVCCCAIDCSKVGPKEQAIGKNADYQITVTNTGDKVLTDVVVSDCAPGATSIVAANGAQINGNNAVWRLKELKPGEKVSFTITLTTCTPGCFTNRVNVTNCQGCNASCEYTTRWRGRPAINSCIVNTENPICIGETTSYNITVVNQGSEDDSNLKVVVKLPEEVQPVAATGDSQGTISGQTVTFAPVKNFPARGTLKFRVDAQGKKSGDARVTVEVSSDSTKVPLTQQESTIVN